MTIFGNVRPRLNAALIDVDDGYIDVGDDYIDVSDEWWSFYILKRYFILLLCMYARSYKIE